jgi:hypothetical protein
MIYTVIAYETTSLTYQIEADSPEAALEKYTQSEQPDVDFGAPEEELLGVDDVRVDGYPDTDTRRCTCDERSWYGEEHDTACPLEGKR